MESKFNLFRSPKDNQFYWNLMAGNSEIILKSEGYTTKENAVSGIASVKLNAPFDERYERKMTVNNQYMFNLKATNGQVIGTSETYTTKQAREGGIAAVKREAPDAPINDETQQS